MINNQSLIQQVQETGDKLRRYLNSKELDQVLETSIAREPKDIEFIAKDLALSDSKKITT